MSDITQSFIGILIGSVILIAIYGVIYYRRAIKFKKETIELEQQQALEVEQWSKRMDGHFSKSDRLMKYDDLRPMTNDEINKTNGYERLRNVPEDERFQVHMPAFDFWQKRMKESISNISNPNKPL